MLISLFFSTCTKNRVALLSERSETFNRNIRWSNLSAASYFISDETRKTIVEKITSHLEKNQIIDFSIFDLGLDQEKKNGSVIVEYTYYGIINQLLQRRKEIQTWKYDSSKQDWFLVEIRDLGNRN